MKTFTFFLDKRMVIHNELIVFYDFVKDLANVCNKLTLIEQNLSDDIISCKVMFNKGLAYEQFIEDVYNKTHLSSLIFLADVLENNGQPSKTRKEIIEEYNLTPLTKQGVLQD